MKRRSFLQCGLGVGVGVGVGVGAGIGLGASTLAAPVVGGAGLQWRRRTLNAMGTSMTLQLAHADAALAERALDGATADIRHIEDQMSLFRPDSALCQLNRSGQLADAHPDLLDILRTAEQVSNASQGAFDITVQPLWRAFEAAQRQGRLPSVAEVLAARQCVGWQGVQIQGNSVRLARPGMGITLNGIAQGFAADKVRARLQSMGIAHALIDAGEWASLGKPAHAGDWTLGVANPRNPQALLAGVALQGRCMATSADDQCTFSPDRVNHHILNPHTGYSPTSLASVSVVAPRCVLADALTKVFFMAGWDAALPLAKAWKVDVLVVDKQGRWRASPGLALRSV
jgi:thiamine biosynthesis lipoprotein